MFLGNFKTTGSWSEVDIADINENVLVQNVSNESVCYIISNETPSKKDKGAILKKSEWIAFNSKNGKLYVKGTNGILYVEKDNRSIGSKIGDIGGFLTEI